VYTLLLKVYLILSTKYTYFILSIRIYFILKSKVKGQLLLLLLYFYSNPYSYSRIYPTPIKMTRAELPEEFSVYKNTLEYITTHLPEESSENRIRLLKGNLHYIYKFP